MNYQFKWSVLWTGESGQWLLSGLITTLELSIVAWLIAIALGILSGSLRTVRFWPLRAAATFYVEFFRNVPLLVWMFFWYFAIPPLLPDGDPGVALRPRARVLGRGVRAGRLQRRALLRGPPLRHPVHSRARSSRPRWPSGLTTFQAYRYVILPVALRLIIPPGTNESLNLLKNSSVALTISVAELTFQTRQIETYTAKAIEALTAGTLIYLVLCVSIASIMSWVERRTAIPGLIVGGRQRR